MSPSRSYIFGAPRLGVKSPFFFFDKALERNAPRGRLTSARRLRRRERVGKKSNTFWKKKGGCVTLVS